jgi:hypothetical protein
MRWLLEDYYRKIVEPLKCSMPQSKEKFARRKLSLAAVLKISSRKYSVIHNTVVIYK